MLEDVDLCIIDVTGDNAGGLSVARQIRELAGSTLPLVLLSDDGKHHYEPEIVSLSIMKPVAGAQLHQLLGALIRKFAQEQDVTEETNPREYKPKSPRVLLVDDEADTKNWLLISWANSDTM